MIRVTIATAAVCLFLGAVLGYREAMYHAASCQAECDTLRGHNICGPWLHGGQDYCVPTREP